MLKELSVFTGSADIRLALTLVAQAASGRPRDEVPELDALGDFFTSEAGRERVRSLAHRHGVTLSLPPADEVRRLFDDELLSARALRQHRGRNVYSACKARLWEELWSPFRDLLTPDDASLDLARTLVGLRTHRGGDGVSDCVDLLRARLSGMDFGVEIISREGHAPLLYAKRDANKSAGTLVMYGHYDVTEPDEAAWRTDPWQLTEEGGRLYGVGVGDNKAALAHRIALLETTDVTPEILWVIQGEEEIASPLAHAVLKPMLASIAPAAWLEENGYFDPDGTQRIIARRIGLQPGSSTPPDAALWQLIEALAADAREFGLEHRVECRGLNKDFFEAGCPFNRAIPTGGRYLAIGVNDPASRIHRSNESVPMWTFPVHARQFRTVLRWAGTDVAR